MRAVFTVSVHEAEHLSSAIGAFKRPIADTFLRYEGPNCLNCGISFEDQTSDECLAQERIVTTVRF